MANGKSYSVAKVSINQMPASLAKILLQKPSLMAEV